ncbi:MAG: hypothetical protein D4R48_00895 [Nitrosomonadales bacterium]|nr:MAG: hypothetical protein D4R48_00895 [Nitrosomonadales bacterium]
MAQQINLLGKEFLPKRELLTAGFMVKVAVGFVLVLVAYVWFVTQEAGKLAGERDEWARRAQEGQARLMQAVKQAPTPESSKALQAEIAVLEENAHAREQVLAVLKSGAVGEGGGFSGMLQAFARQSLNGVWLTGISTNSAGDQMRISGRAVSPELIAQYISGLSSERALHGRNFVAFEVSQPRQEPVKEQKPAGDVQTDYIEFILSGEKQATGPSAEKAAAKPAVGVKS